MSANVQLIQQAMMQTPPKMIQMSYTKQGGITELYIVEPYELDFAEGILWAYKTNDPLKPGIRKFFLHMINNEQVLEQYTYTPRWPLYPGGRF